MKSRFILLLTVALFAMAFIFAWIYQSKPKINETQQQTVEAVEYKDPAVESLAQSVMELQNKIEALSDRLDKKIHLMQQQQTALLDSQKAPAESEEISEEYARQEAEDWYERQMEKLDAALVSVPKDEKWSSSTTGRLEEVFQNLNDFEIKEISCSGVLCKVNARISSQDLEDAGGIDGLLHGTMGWEGQTMASVNEATGEVMVYLLREGVDLISENASGEVK